MNTLAPETRYGPMLYNDKDPFFRGALARYGEWAWLEASFWSRLIAPGDIVISAGANIGVNVVHLAKLVGKTGAVFAFEPQLPLWQLCIANACLANVNQWVRCFNAALGAQLGTLQMPTIEYDGPDTSFGGFSLRDTNVPDEVPRYPVPIRTIDSLGLPRVEFIQLDVEGMEDEVLKGAQETIARCRPILYVEADHPQSTVAMFKRLPRIGYRPHWHRVPFYNPDNFRGDPENLWPEAMVNSWLCVPDTQPAESIGLPVVTDPLYAPEVACA